MKRTALRIRPYFFFMILCTVRCRCVSIVLQQNRAQLATWRAAAAVNVTYIHVSSSAVVVRSFSFDAYLSFVYDHGASRPCTSILLLYPASKILEHGTACVTPGRKFEPVNKHPAGSSTRGHSQHAVSGSYLMSGRHSNVARTRLMHESVQCAHTVELLLVVHHVVGATEYE